MAMPAIMGTPVITVASGGMPVVNVTATTPALGMPVTESTLAKGGIPITVVAAGKPGLAITKV